MTFTFGIITDGTNHDRVDQVIRSILRQGIPTFEIIVVGGKRPAYPSVKHIEFNETAKHAWITRKKNLIVQQAQYENIVFMHDYLVLGPDWFDGYMKFGNQFNICINPLLNPDNSRYRDLSFFPAFRHMIGMGFDMRNSTELYPTVPNMGEHECLIPYHNYKESRELCSWMYISGAYWIAKKKVMSEFPLNESLSWGQGEDVLWSEQVKSKYTFSFNVHSTCRLLKFKEPVFTVLKPATVAILQSRGLLT